MKISKVKKFQEGGQAPAPVEQAQGQEGQAPQEGGNPQEQIMQMAEQIIQQMGPEAAGALAQIIIQMLQEGQQQQPTYQRKGGKLVRIN